MMTSTRDALKLFAISNQLLEHDLDRIEEEFGVDLKRGHRRAIDQDESYYPQIDRAIRSEASRMAPHYEVFYSLEKSIRTLIVDTLVDAESTAWWDSGRIPERVKREAESRLKKEVDFGATQRSKEPIDFTTFGELGEIIKANWDVFGSLFQSPRAVERVMANLNTLRGPIAHCSPLAEDEIVRLRLSVRDWFRLME